MVRSWIERLIARTEAERAILPISDTLLDEIGPVDLAEDRHESEERWQVASELSILESQMAGHHFWSLNTEGEGHRAEALERIRDVMPGVLRLHLTKTAHILDEMVILLERIDER
ncbi:hypothetical protein D9V28_07200 [Mycetocola zhadangensis]|uniref:Uncharacterized protein n=1 Tax=Mycetocola zhadangensis TaxID=1164595 RepID=A0A3L7J1A7_9MICO|nr:hypothetical protein D9V28_07200 [Mycetocola zhadangensis]GGE96804.1 hypothetical protein GCM10011313_19770 [Mycetocola zhadangensis]